MNKYEVLSTYEINKILSKYKVFKGAFPADLIPLTGRSSEQAFIINTDKSDLAGSHWTALVIQNKKCFFFDPLGSECLNMKLLFNLKARGFSYYKYSAKQIQPYKNNNCGYYCIAFILCMIKTSSIVKFVSMFAEDSEKNNKICYDFIMKYI